MEQPYNPHRDMTDAGRKAALACRGECGWDVCKAWNRSNATVPLPDKLTAVEFVYAVLKPNMTLEQFQHNVNAGPDRGFSYQAFVKDRRLVQAVALLQDIRDVASGEKQVALDDLDGLKWIEAQILKLWDNWLSNV